jgi:2-polyprenyl-3-methyl-5-hydroxy-6-metoxy-1,4-benzoquinol methylase
VPEYKIWHLIEYITKNYRTMCKICTDLDQVKSSAFAEKLLQVYNQGALSLMISIGHRSGLFDVMCNMSDSTSEEIAREAGLNERYVREWLHAMATGEIIEVTGDGQKFYLSPEHAAFLTRQAGADNLGVFAQYIPLLGAVEDRILECFEQGGGVAYEEYGRFHEVMAEDSGQSVLNTLIELTLPLVPGIIEKLKSGIRVLDVGCGSGRALNLMAKTFPKSKFYGYDFCLEPIETAKKEAEKLGLTNVYFEQKDLTDYVPDQQFDFITAFDAIHDQARPDIVLDSINKSLTKGGSFLMQDIDGRTNVSENLDHPLGTLLYTISCLHCMTVSLAQGGMGLGAMWGTDKALEMLNDAGFRNIDIQRLDHDIQNCYYIIKK